MRRKIELLAPAANADIAIEAIKHGADAVYIGASSHGARKNASNSIDDIRRVVDFAHDFHARVYVTVNTIIYENELRQVERLCRDLYQAGVDALIVQDMALLRLDIPPIALHASTQCDTRSVEKAVFLEKVGFSQIVLARELSLKEISSICNAVSVPVECFVHGALCVSYSGRCHISQHCRSRSANRGECAQMCRLPYTLTDGNGRVICKDRHVLSMRDLNLSQHIVEMLNAGVSSFKIEGRLKDASYVKNVTAAYSKIINDIIISNPDRFERSSDGKSHVSFEPDLNKSFNRGFTTYFLLDRAPACISSPLTPKSMGEVIRDVSCLNNGDGISFFDKSGNYTGTKVNGIKGDKILTPEGILKLSDIEIHRTFDNEWSKRLARETAKRKISLEITIDDNCLSGKDERGVSATVPLDTTKEKALKPMAPQSVLSRTGNTIYEVTRVINNLSQDTFIPASQLTAIRNRLIDLLDITNKVTYKFDIRKKENMEFQYVSDNIDYRDNVANSIAVEFYSSHGVSHIEKAAEVCKTNLRKGSVVMTTRHCILRELGMCKKKKQSLSKITEPLVISNGSDHYRLHFACERCEMEVLVD